MMFEHKYMNAGRTDRIQILRDRSPKPDEARLLDDVEKYGCHIVHVREEHGIPGWSYTIGLNETQASPELIVVGLKDNVAQYLLNEGARRLKESSHSLDGHRESGLLADVECEFRNVEQRWLRQGWGTRYGSTTGMSSGCFNVFTPI
jgi:hypothetical protein